MSQQAIFCGASRQWGSMCTMAWTARPWVASPSSGYGIQWRVHGHGFRPTECARCTKDLNVNGPGRVEGISSLRYSTPFLPAVQQELAFDKVVFNFPHIGGGTGDDAEANRSMLADFFKQVCTYPMIWRESRPRFYLLLRGCCSVQNG